METITKKARRLAYRTGPALAMALTCSFAAFQGAPVASAQLFAPSLAQAEQEDPSQIDAQQWVAARGPDELDLELLEATPPAVGGTMTVRLRVTNTSDEAVGDLQVTSRRDDAVTTTAQARTQLAAGAYPYFGASASAGELGPGASREVELAVPTGLGEESTLAITEPGAYPLLFTLTGTRNGQATSFAEERMLLDVQPDPAAPHTEEAAPDQEGSEGEVEPQPAHNLSLIYPITADVDIVPGETGGEELILSNDNLAGELKDGGRLDQLLDDYLDHNLKGAGCVALDPALVDTVDRMADGYTVNSTRPSTAQRPQRLRDSWGNNDSNDRGTPGSGSEDAAAWIERLKGVDCIMTMPWANADADAVADTNNEWLSYEAIERGGETIESVLDKPLSTTLIAPGSGSISHQLEVPTLVADNTQWVGKAATFDASLGALLAQTGSKPQTVGYSNPELRYDYTLDSERSRALTGAASLAVASAQENVVAKLPNYLDPSAARAVLDTAQRLLDDGTMVARGVATLPAEDPSPDNGETPGSPYVDPAAFHDADITRIEQQARYTDELTNIMVNDPAIAMTRYGFTLPLRRDLLTALSLNERDTLKGYTASASASNDRLARNTEMLRTLRSSVSLIPPGNVYTRVSESSPLLIVAENGLPLPVVATLEYEGPDGASLNTPATVRIPAQGSITVSMTADLPSGTDRTDLRLWLATPDEHAIADPITIAVQTRAGIVSVYGVGAIAALALIFALLFRLGKRRKKKSQR